MDFIDFDLRPGPVLMRRNWHGQDSDDATELNVTGRAFELLFDTVRIEPGVTLGDILGLLDACPPLELYWSWGVDTATGCYSNVHRLDLHGVGPVLTVDAPEHGRNAGERIQWSVSLTPDRQLLGLLVRFREDFEITEEDIDTRSFGTAIASGRCKDATLGQVIHGVAELDTVISCSYSYSCASSSTQARTS